jgi:integrase
MKLAFCPIFVLQCIWFYLDSGIEDRRRQTRMANKQIVNGIRVYSRHAADCKHIDDAAYLKCGCAKWLQFQLDGKQVRESTGTRSITQAQKVAEEKDRELRGETLVVAKADAKTVASAVGDWLEFRSANGLGNEKPELMSRKLTGWCLDNGIAFLHQLTSERLIHFRSSLPYRTKTSSSLKVHWSVICGFFGWCVGAGLLTTNPIPNSRVHPQFRIKFQKPEVEVPTKQEIERVLMKASGVERLFLLTMRYSGMAITDTTKLNRDSLTGNLIRGNRSKTGERFRVRIPEFLADQLHALPANKQNFFWEEGVTIKRMVQRWEKALRPIFKKAGVKMTPHKFRHFFVSEQLGMGTPGEAVSIMVGTSPAEIRQTYLHWVREAEDRQDTLQSQAWMQMGLDANGNPKRTSVQ